MSIYDKASLIQIPSGYKAGKLYSVIPNSGAGDFTVTGDAEGDATRVNSQGLIETVNANVPRLDYPFIDGVVQDCPRLLLEPTRINQISKSRDFEGWQDLGGSETVTNNDAIAPDGSNTAATIEKTGSDNSTLRFYTTYTNYSTVRSASIYIKKLSGNPTVSFGITDTQDSITPTDEWVRYTIDNVTPSDFGVNIFVDIEVSGVSGDKISVWGAQLEEGTYSTSVIETAGSEVTRLKDECTNGGNADLFNVTEGTLFLDVYDFKSSANPEITLSSGFATNRITLVYYPSSNQLRFYISSNNVVQADQFVSYTYSQRNKIALRYKQNDFKAYINGTQVFSDTSGNTPIALSRFDFSKYDQTNGFFEGEVYQTMIFNEALSDSELQTLTTL